ncbi:MAG TPA: rhomboid family intramembrane serine protease [Bacteroidia bacterium]|nr:rhomboid family intramembrane serine protease [Bacteroidia bacterium]
MSNTSLGDRLGRFRAFSVVTQILLINGVFFLLCNIIANVVNPALINYFTMPSNLSQLLVRFYTPFTYMFTHLEVSHVFFNMIYFYFMGEIFSSIVGEKRLWFVYILGGLAGAIFYSLFFNLFIQGNFYLLGASASVTAVSIVAAIYAPNMPVSVFFIGSFPLKWVVLVLFLLSTIIDISVNTGGKVAHIGGAFFGLLYGMQLKKGNDLMDLFKRKANTKSKNLKIVHSIKVDADEKTLDEILDKINKSGYESLSKHEKETLQKIASKK